MSDDNDEIIADVHQKLADALKVSRDDVIVERVGGRAAERKDAIDKLRSSTVLPRRG